VAAPAPPREVVKPNDGWTAVKPPRNPGRTNQIKNDPKPPATQPGIKPLSKEALEKIFGDAMSKVGGPGTAPFGTYGTGPGGGKYDPLNWYYSMVKAAMYEAWQQPSALAGTKGLLTRALIRVQRDGKIIQRSLDLSSGNALMDSSVMTAVESVAQLEALPPGFGGDYKDITIDFRLTETPLAE
jgi:TonB family protein